MAVIRNIPGEVDGTKLALAREARGLSQFQFATAAGYSQVHQHRLEKPGKHYPPKETVEAIAGVLREFSVIGEKKVFSGTDE